MLKSSASHRGSYNTSNYSYKKDPQLRPNKWAGRPPKLDARARRALIRHVERNPHDKLASLGTPSRSGQKLSRKTVRSYLKTAGYLRFKARRKPFLTKKHKAARLRWAREHVGWTLEDWIRVIWTDEATFETGLDSCTCYVTRRPGTAMESRYLKPTFKSGRTTLGIWGGEEKDRGVSCSVFTTCRKSFNLKLSKLATVRMPLQRLTMNSDYSEGSESLINPLPQKSNRNPPRAILISSSRTTANSAPQAKSIPQFSNNVLVPKNSTATTNPRNSMGNAFQRQPKSYGTSRS